MTKSNTTISPYIIGFCLKTICNIIIIPYFSTPFLKEFNRRLRPNCLNNFCSIKDLLIFIECNCTCSVIKMWSLSIRIFRLDYSLNISSNCILKGDCDQNTCTNDCFCNSPRNNILSIYWSK